MMKIGLYEGFKIYWMKPDVAFVKTRTVGLFQRAGQEI